MIEFFGLVLRALKSTLSSAEVLINVATSVMEYGLLSSALLLPSHSHAIIAYCLVAIVQHDLQLKRLTYEVLQILSISLMDKTPLVDLFERTDFNNVKELDCPLFPGLFD